MSRRRKGVCSPVFLRIDCEGRTIHPLLLPSGGELQGEKSMKLSIIIPAYNAEPYIDKLIERLEPQISKDIEVIVVDDGSKKPYKGPKWAKVIRQENGGASAARNTGLDKANGDYIAFIDADDLVTEDYIQQVMAKIDEGFDYVYLSWQTTGNGWKAKVILNTPSDKFPPDNLCVWNRIYRRDMIGDIRFNTKKKVAEDAEFLRLVESDEAKQSRKRGFISKPIYLYRSDTPNSLSKRFAGGSLDTKRVIYYFHHVTADMDLLPEVIEADKEAEVIIMTNRNDQPELTKYAMVIPPLSRKIHSITCIFSAEYIAATACPPCNS